MKDGKIQHQGTVEEIQERDPELYSTWQDVIQKASESEAADSESGNETDTIEEEREKLKRQISRQMTVEETSKDVKGKYLRIILPFSCQMQIGALTISIHLG